MIESGFSGRKAVAIYGYDYSDFPMDPAIQAFEMLGRATVLIGERVVHSYDDLVHPVHKAGRVFAWEVMRSKDGTITTKQAPS